MLARRPSADPRRSPIRLSILRIMQQRDGSQSNATTRGHISKRNSSHRLVIRVPGRWQSTNGMAHPVSHAKSGTVAAHGSTHTEVQKHNASVLVHRERGTWNQTCASPRCWPLAQISNVSLFPCKEQAVSSRFPLHPCQLHCREPKRTLDLPLLHSHPLPAGMYGDCYPLTSAALQRSLVQAGNARFRHVIDRSVAAAIKSGTMPPLMLLTVVRPEFDHPSEQA